MQESNEITQKRIFKLNKILKTDTIWECDVYRELKSNKEMKDFFNDLGNDRGQIGF